jgi:hypothetical protein
MVAQDARILFTIIVLPRLLLPAFRTTIDLFLYLEGYQTWVCIPCGAGIKPKHY